MVNEVASQKLIVLDNIRIRTQLSTFRFLRQILDRFSASIASGSGKLTRQIQRTINKMRQRTRQINIMLSNKSNLERRKPCTQLVGGILVTRGAENNLVLEMTQPKDEIILKMIKQQDEMEEERILKQQNEKVEEEMIWDAVNFALAQLDLDSSSQESEESDDLRDLICGEVPTMRIFGEERLIPELDFSDDRSSSCLKTNFNNPNVKVSPMSNQLFEELQSLWTSLGCGGNLEEQLQSQPYGEQVNNEARRLWSGTSAPGWATATAA